MLKEDEVIQRVHARYTCRTVIGRGPAPPMVDPAVYGHHGSYARAGIRYWGFKLEAGRDKFIQDYNATPWEPT